MSTTHDLLHLQRRACALEADLAALTTRVRVAAAARHAVRAGGMLDAAVREIGAALAHEHLREVDAAVEEPLTVHVISPGADRADELVRTIPAEISSMSTRTAALRLGAPYDAAGARAVGEVLRRNGWRQLGFEGRWFRVDDASGAGAGQEQRR